MSDELTNKPKGKTIKRYKLSTKKLSVDASIAQADNQMESGYSDGVNTDINTSGNSYGDTNVAIDLSFGNEDSFDDAAEGDLWQEDVDGSSGKSGGLAGILQNKGMMIGAGCAAAAVALFSAWAFVLPSAFYHSAQSAMDRGDYDKAVKMYERSCKTGLFGDYKDAQEMADYGVYEIASQECLYSGDYEGAIEAAVKLGDSVLEQQCRYEYAQELNMMGEYEEANWQLDLAGDYPGAAELLAENHYDLGSAYLEDGNVEDAIAELTKAGDAEDAQALLTDAKYAYVKKHYDRSEELTYLYVSELKSANYKDSASLYDDLYGWKCKVYAVNTRIDDDLTNLKELNVADPIYFHLLLEGGPYGDPELIMTAKVELPNGSVATQLVKDGNTSNGYTSNSHVHFGFANGLYQDPKNGRTGRLRITFYDDNNHELCVGSVYLAK